MFAVDDILVADAVLDAPFTCNLGSCRGACCVQGESGAPLEEAELQKVEEAADVLRSQLRPEARAVIDAQGAWTEEAPGEFATSCVDGAECVFVVYDRGVARCAMQQAYHRGRFDFEKPISCHLFPIRVETMGQTTVLNYEQIDLCRPAVKHGRRLGVNLVEFLREPLVRRFGDARYERLQAACRNRVAELATATVR